MKSARRPVRRFRKLLISLQIAVLTAFAPGAALAEESSFLDTFFSEGFDAVVLRPLGSVRLAVGIVALIPTGILYTLKMPLDGDAGALQEITELLVVEPANFVFRRPLGEDLAGG
jgi:hypothetical protein